LAIENIQDKKKQLAELADVLNSFKSEAVQLRLLEYILGENGSNAVPLPKRDDTKPRARRKPRKQTKQTKTEEEEGNSAVPSKKKAAAHGNGAKATIAQLVEGDFFKQPRTIGEIVDHCKHNLARSFKANEISGKLGQLIRTNQLTRTRNADNQYEYKKL
jgi:hypothetical protein